MSKPWIPSNFEDVCKRAAGRRRYHAQRQRAQFSRRWKVLSELEQADWDTYGMGRTLARKFGVSQATVSRDIRHLRALRMKLGPKASKIISAGFEGLSKSPAGVG